MRRWRGRGATRVLRGDPRWPVLIRHAWTIRPSRSCAGRCSSDPVARLLSLTTTVAESLQPQVSPYTYRYSLGSHTIVIWQSPHLIR